MNKGKLLILGLALICFPMIQNCGGGGGGGGSHSDVIVAEQLINDGWANIERGAYGTAQGNLLQALGQPLTDAQRVAAHNALGWAYAKDGKIYESIQYFEVAATSVPPENEAKVGLAGALLWRHQTTEDYKRAAELLGNMPPEKFSSPHSFLALNSAKVHALTALCYALSGEMDMAKTYINKAAALDSMSVGTTVDRIDDAFQLLGWKD